MLGAVVMWWAKCEVHLFVSAFPAHTQGRSFHKLQKEANVPKIISITTVFGIAVRLQSIQNPSTEFNF